MITNLTSSGLSDRYERAINVLFTPQAISFLRQLRASTEDDPQFVDENEHSLRPQVQQILNQGGIIWDQQILDREWKTIVMEAIVRLRCTEKTSNTNQVL